MLRLQLLLEAAVVPDAEVPTGETLPVVQPVFAHRISESGAIHVKACKYVILTGGVSFRTGKL
jgi:hypothetical protein